VGEEGVRILEELRRAKRSLEEGGEGGRRIFIINEYENTYINMRKGFITFFSVGSESIK